ncbi:pentatricopeptide repeat-containing protein At3g18970-like [Bidens hawaiensis]|uniref:pentatricopeptide repeat-containing protein At3g18970-like n=1 Tax=Bidens hawaiensis TaxID=980011 RepID=UPI00404934D0
MLPRLRPLSLLHHYKSSLTTTHLTQIHSQLISNGLTHSPSILARLIERYCASSPPHAHLITTHFYNHNNEPNPYLFNVLIRCTPPADSITVFANWVSKQTLKFDDFTYIFVLGACARRAKALREGLQIHCRVIKHGCLSNVMLQTTLIHFYVKTDACRFARKVFDEMPVRTRTAATWNSLIAGYCARKDHARDGLLLFVDMLTGDYGVKANDTTLVCVLSAVARLGYLETGVGIHACIEKTIGGVESDVYIGTGLVDMYAKCGCLDAGLNLFMRMRHKNVHTWTAMVSGLAVNGKGKRALKLFNDMIDSGISPNSVTFTSLLLACSQAGLVKEGLSLFKIMKTKFCIVPLSHHYGCIVDLLARAGHLEDAFEFIVSEKVESDEVLWRSLLHACRLHNDVVMGEKVAKILISMKPEFDVKGCDRNEDYVALSNMCASAGRWEEVAKVREMIIDKGIRSDPAVSAVFT